MSGFRALLAAVVIASVVGCTATPSPSATPAASDTPSEPAATPTATGTGGASPIASPSVPAEPPLSLGLPETADGRTVVVGVAPDVGEAAGTLTVTVTSLADTRIDELVLRWPTELAGSMVLAPFEPTESRISDNGPPLVQEWTKWVIGPGEQGEPDGTTSVGWGPLLAGATLTIPLVVTRVAPDPVAFDLQVLAGNDLLTLDGGEPGELRVEVP